MSHAEPITGGMGRLLLRDGSGGAYLRPTFQFVILTIVAVFLVACAQSTQEAQLSPAERVFLAVDPQALWVEAFEKHRIPVSPKSTFRSDQTLVYPALYEFGKKLMIEILTDIYSDEELTEIANVIESIRRGDPGGTYDIEPESARRLLEKLVNAEAEAKRRVRKAVFEVVVCDIPYKHRGTVPLIECLVQEGTVVR